MTIQKVIIRICSLVMLISGVVILFATLFPIFSYEWESARRYPILISSLIDDDTASFKLIGTDYTRASNWFSDEVENDDLEFEQVTYFTITIPKLRIENASVAVGGEDLSKSLIQYLGSALPGKVGNSVIFGHSILPTFYNPENYLSVFSTLPTLDKGDEIFVYYDSVNYRYVVENMFEVRPTDIQILEQNSYHPYLSLVTCTPPGHPLKPKRLIVRAKLMPMEDLGFNN